MIGILPARSTKRWMRFPQGSGGIALSPPVSEECTMAILPKFGLRVGGKIMQMRGMSSSRLAVLAIGLALAAFASSAMADSATNTVGSQSGTPFKASCGPGKALIGWAYNATDRLTAIAPLCQAVSA